MEIYDYHKAITQDILQYITDNDVLNYDYKDKDELYDILEQECWDEDSITGNGPFGYDTEENCELYLYHNINLLLNAMQEFDISWNSFGKEIYNGRLARYCDTLIRTNLFHECLSNALMTLKSEKGEDK